MDTLVRSRKKLIEVALPLEAINKAAAREKSIRHGHPSTLHLWWARRPLAAARAVIFSQMVDDPSANPDLFLTEKAQEKERKRLFKIIEELVLWENTMNEEVLQRAREEIWQSWRRTCADNADHPHAKELFDRHKLPAFHDPFAGGGAIPLEAQRLGLESYASDLNPVAVLINKAMIEIPPKFAGKPPLNPDAHKGQLGTKTWKGAQGLAEDVRYYGQWMQEEAEKRIGYLYPKIEITAAMARERPDLKALVGQKLTVTAWLWARTVKSPNPAFRNVDVPLVSTFMLSIKPGKEAWVEPVIESDGYRFNVKLGQPKNVDAAKAGTKLGRGANFQCLMSGAPIAGDYIKAEGKAGRLSARLMAIVAAGDRGRFFLSPLAEQEAAARKAIPDWKPEGAVPPRLTGGTCVPYGLTTWGDLFTPRQVVALTTFSQLVGETMERVRADAPPRAAKESNGPMSYADAIGVYLSLAVSKLADRSSSICSWALLRQHPINTFSRQAIPMTWDYAESNPIGGASGNFSGGIKSIADGLLNCDPRCSGKAEQLDAAKQVLSDGKIVATDPPYYDNIAYADLSDFFYVWLRRSLRHVIPDLFATVAVPKAEELVATAYRHGSVEKAEAFFLKGMTQAMQQLAQNGHPSFPVTMYYAFKQSESRSDIGTHSSGWETFLDAVIRAGFGVSGTWPMRTEVTDKLKAATNALASSIVLVCRPRAADAPTVTRKEFAAALQQELAESVRHLQAGNIAPVDLAQGAIGPGMAVFTRYSKVLDAQGKPLSVREALLLINETLDTALAEQEGDFDSDSRWALAWFDQYGFADGEFGVAEILSKAKNTSVDGIVEAGVAHSKAGKVRLLRPNELSVDWDPTTDFRLTHWEIVHHLIRALETSGESAAAEIVTKLGSKAETARALCYRLYTLCERKKRAAEALSYNALVQSWPEILRLAKEQASAVPVQQELV